MKKYSLLLIFGLIWLQSIEAKEYSDQCLVDTKTIDQEAVIIDVRTKQEYAFGHPPGAINIPYEFDREGERVLNTNFVAQVNRLTEEDYEIPLIIICRIGVRSVKAAELLADEGYEDITNIQKGFLKGWKKAGLPVEK
jgi:rhodanese-related sulfurtransferase